MGRIITKAVINGFKGVDREFDFGNLNVISGPNKSGKTAVAQAIKWAVLGNIPASIGGNANTTKKLTQFASSDRMAVALDCSGDKLAVAIEGGKLEETGGGFLDAIREDRATKMLLNPEGFFQLSKPAKVKMMAEMVMMDDSGILDQLRDLPGLLTNSQELASLLDYVEQITSQEIAHSEMVMETTAHVGKVKNSITATVTALKKTLKTLQSEEMIARSSLELRDDIAKLEGDLDIAKAKRERGAVSVDNLKEHIREAEATTKMVKEKIDELKEAITDTKTGITQLEMAESQFVEQIAEVRKEIAEEENKGDDQWIPLEDENAIAFDDGQEVDLQVRVVWPITDMDSLQVKAYRKPGKRDEELLDSLNTELGELLVKESGKVEEIKSAKDLLLAQESSMQNYAMQIKAITADVILYKEKLKDAEKDPAGDVEHLPEVIEEIALKLEKARGALEKVIGIEASRKEREALTNELEEAELVLHDYKTVIGRLTDITTDAQRNAPESDMLETINALAEGCLRGGRVEYEDGELFQTYEGARIGLTGFSGMETAVTITGLSAFFANSSDALLPVILVDELNVFDPEHRKVFVGNLESAVEAGTISQVIVTDWTDADMTGENWEGFKFS